MQLSPLQSALSANSLARLKLACAGEVLDDDYHRALYSTDASLYQIQPLAVVVPRTRDDVKAVVEFAAEERVPLIVRGSGTSLSGQSIGAGIVVDFSKYLNRIIELDPRAATVRVEPGVVLDQLNAAAAAHGLQFGADVATSSRANLGGMIGNNSAGARSIRHGKTVDQVISLDVLAADSTPATLRPLTPADLATEQRRTDRWGQIYRDVPAIVARERDEIIARFPPILRRVSGYNLDEFVPECRARGPAPPCVADLRRVEAERFPGADFNLAKLIVGAEGTLACVTSATLHLLSLPARRGVVVLHFDSLAAAVGATNPILASPNGPPAAIELLDGRIVRMAENSLEYRNYLDFVVGRPESLVLVELIGSTDEDLQRQAAELTDRLRGQPGLYHVLEALEPRLYAHVWACRKAAMPLLYAIPGLRKPLAFVEDTAVDPARLPEFTARFREILQRNGTDGAFYGHASVGCLHIRPLLDTADRADVARLEKISDEVCRLVLEFHGTMSGEHGDGLARSYLNPRLFGPRIYQAFKEIKAAFDPAGILNPGKVVDGPSPIENLRTSPETKPLAVPTLFDFSREGGSLFRAAEMCNGNGVCRKRTTGTMCPSFMVTGDEEHSTRGRANALRLVLSGALPPERLTDRRMYDTFDLCLQCKGCKAECPSNVDVAKLKAEFLHHYHAAHGTPLAARLMADVARLNRWGSALAPLSNWLGHLPGLPWLAEKLFGIDRRRPWPRFERNHFSRWFRARRLPAPLSPGGKGAGGEGVGVSQPSRGPIVLLDDCLTSYCEPQVNRAAVAVLEAAGYEVHLAGLECCGRAAISKGLLERARGLARTNVERLRPWVERGIPIVGCEPSCLLTLADEYVDLVPGEAAQKLAKSVSLIDTHLVQAGIALPPASQVSGSVLVHGHCHQKALVGMNDTLAMLAPHFAASPKLLDSGCCGMAGSFGYEHYDLSQKIGERVLFPAIRQSPDALVIAPGFSCRHQILHGTGRVARHPVEVLAEALTKQGPAADGRR